MPTHTLGGGGLLWLRCVAVSLVLSVLIIIQFSCGPHGKVSTIKTLTPRLSGCETIAANGERKKEFRLFSPVDARLQSQSDDTICFILNVLEDHQQFGTRAETVVPTQM